MRGRTNQIKPLEWCGKYKQAFGIMISAAIGLSSTAGLPASAQTHQLHMPTKLAAPRPVADNYQPDTLLVMPTATAEMDDINDAIREAHGLIVGELMIGKKKVLIIQTEKGKLAETEKKFGKDKKDFAMMQRNYRAEAQNNPPVDPDPLFPTEWHLGAVNAQSAWQTASGSMVRVGVFDSGCQAGIVDLSGNTSRGVDATSDAAKILYGAGTGIGALLGGPIGGYLGGIIGAGTAGLVAPSGQNDFLGHGTEVATTIAAAQNKTNTVGVAPSATIVPVRMSTLVPASGSKGPSATADTVAVIVGLSFAKTQLVRIVNISYDGLQMADPTKNPILHAAFIDFHDVYGGLVVMSAGNDSTKTGAFPLPYLIVVSAIDNSFGLASFSNYGANLWFTAPGTNIACQDNQGNAQTPQGTSFSAPIVSGVAALAWSSNPLLTNTQVEFVLKSSTGYSGWNQYYGFGMPDAAKAVKIARGNI
jgi:hypothetical protein